jgi:thioester reductase-like protein
MAIFVTGSTGYLGSYLVAGLFNDHRDRLNLLVRAKTDQEARERLWISPTAF